MYKIPQGEIDELLAGVMDSISDPLAKDLCTVKEKGDTSGKDGYRRVKDELPNDSDRGVDVPPGAEVESTDDEIVSYNWAADKQVASGYITVEDENELSSFNRDAVSDKLESLLTSASFKVDKKLADFLVDPNENAALTNFDGPWDDQGANSSPYTNLNSEIEDKNVLRPDTLIVAPDVVEALRSHPATKEQISNFDGGGMVGADAVLDALQQTHRYIRNVEVFEEPFDDQPAGLGFNMADVFSGNVWIGNRASLLMYWPDVPKNPYTMQQPIARRSSIELTTGLFVDYQRVRSKFGAFLKEGGSTGVLS